MFELYHDTGIPSADFSMHEPEPYPGYNLAVIFVHQSIFMVMFDGRKRITGKMYLVPSFIHGSNKIIAVLKGVSPKGIMTFSTHGVQIHYLEGREDECPVYFKPSSNNSRWRICVRINWVSFSGNTMFQLLPLQWNTITTILLLGCIVWRLTNLSPFVYHNTITDVLQLNKCR